MLFLRINIDALHIFHVQNENNARQTWTYQGLLARRIKELRFITLTGGGGDNLIGLTNGDVPLFRVTFFPKNAELWVSVFKLSAEL